MNVIAFFLLAIFILANSKTNSKRRSASRGDDFNRAEDGNNGESEAFITDRKQTSLYRNPLFRSIKLHLLTIVVKIRKRALPHYLWNKFMSLGEQRVIACDLVTSKAQDCGRPTKNIYFFRGFSSCTDPIKDSLCHPRCLFR